FLLIVGVVTVCTPMLVYIYRYAAYPELTVCSSGKPGVFEGPYICCHSFYESSWGDVRVILLQRITEKRTWEAAHGYPSWFAHYAGGRLAVEDRLVVPGSSVLVFYAEND